MKRYLGTGLVVLLSGGTVAAQSAPESKEVRAATALQWSTYVTAAMSKDATSLVSIFTPDARLLSDPGGAEDIRSAEAYRALAAGAFQALTVVSLHVDPDEVTVLGPSEALEIGKWSEEYEIQGQAEHVKVFGAYMGLWRRQPDGRWLLNRFIRNRHDFANPTFAESLGR